MNKSSLSLTTALCLACGLLHAQDPADTQQDLRINPDIEFSQVKSTVSYPSYVRTGSNHIIMNGDDWTSLAQSLRGADSTRINIVHIGDSHLSHVTVSRSNSARRAGLWLYRLSLPALTSLMTTRYPHRLL